MWPAADVVVSLDTKSDKVTSIALLRTQSVHLKVHEPSGRVPRGIHSTISADRKRGLSNGHEGPS